MNLCSDNHEEICYEGRNCPCCAIIAEKERLENKIGILEETLVELKDEISYFITKYGVESNQI